MNNASDRKGAIIYFLPTFGINYERTGDNLATINNLLNATIQKLNQVALAAGIQTINIWELINWVYVVHYWSLLYDFGQVQPSLYKRSGLFPDIYVPNEYPDMNNIFINDTLFEIYGLYFTNTIVPLLGGSNRDAYSFKALDLTNQLKPVHVAFNVPYLCTQMQLKTPLSVLISVLSANYTFINPVFAFIMIFGGWYQRKQHPKEGTLFLLLELSLANWCEGCIMKGSEKCNVVDEES